VLEIEGSRASAEAAWSAATAAGHFTAMQVRGGRTRGLALHLARLEAANREMFGAAFDGDRIRELIRHALGETKDGSVRVYCVETEAQPATVVTVKESGGVRSPQRLRSVRYQRPDAHLKHLATEQGYHSRLASRGGFDDALLTGDGGIVAESATANIGFFDADGVVWPDAPCLHGITMQLLERTLPELGVRSRRAPVRLDDVASFEGAFLTSARGVAAVSGIDEADLPARPERVRMLADAYDAVPWDAF
jgi:branched-subunit amino acid aminotransferase/4-amino-4-deoxychorismate lyase